MHPLDCNCHMCHDLMWTDYEADAPETYHECVRCGEETEQRTLREHGLGMYSIEPLCPACWTDEDEYDALRKQLY